MPHAFPIPRRASLVILMATAITLAASPLRAQTPAYKNTDLPFKDRVADLVSQMSVEEKASQLQMVPRAIPRLGISSCNWWTEALHGMSRADPATIFPQSIGLAATWDPPLIHDVADAISDEARAMFNPNQLTRRGYGLMLWCPTINMARDPRWGRTEETYGEDPFLAGRLGVAYCKGLQGDDPKYLKTAATPKHFAVHNQEVGRNNRSFDVSERDLREYYLPAFRACFIEGKAASTMAAHNGISVIGMPAITKIPCMANPLLLSEILRKEWGFDGAVVTDWNSLGYLVHDHKYVDDEIQGVAVSIRAGVDVFDSQQDETSQIVSAVNGKFLTEAELDAAVTHNLMVRMRLGFFDQEVWQKFSRPASIIGSPPHVALALKSAQESIVLLQNNPVAPGFGVEKLLPLDLKNVHSIAVIGPFADAAQYGNYSPRPLPGHAVTPLDALRAAVGPRVRLVTVDWGDTQDSVDLASQCDVVIVVMGYSPGMETEGTDKPDIQLPRESALKKIVRANPKTIVVLEGGSPMGLDWVKKNVPACMMAWYPGEQGGTAIADVLLGKYNPSGRLPITFYRSTDDLPKIDDYDVTKGRTYWYAEKPVPFVFGHGLSYTTFDYTDLKIQPLAPADQTATVTVTVTNSGAMTGDELVQLYVHKPDSAVTRPIKQLKAFERINIPAKESRTVKLSFPLTELAYWDAPHQKWTIEPGAYDIQIGASSADIRLHATLDIKIPPPIPPGRL